MSDLIQHYETIYTHAATHRAARRSSRLSVCVVTDAAGQVLVERTATLLASRRAARKRQVAATR